MRSVSVLSYPVYFVCLLYITSHMLTDGTGQQEEGPCVEHLSATQAGQMAVLLLSPPLVFSEPLIF